MAHDLYRLTETDAAARATVLKRASQRPELRELAERPLLLTLMARLQTKGGGSLPENREELYGQSVDMLLDEWEGLKLRRDDNGQPVVVEPSLSEWLNASRENIRRELEQLAYQAHRQQPELVGTADIRQDELINALLAASRERPDARLMRIEEYLRDRAGLLTSHGEGLYQFPHRSFQEFLAACHLARFDYPDTLSRLARSDANRWREVTLLAAARSKATPTALWELVEELCARDEAPAAGEPEADSEAQWGALLAGQVLHETGLAAADPHLQPRHERKRRRVRDWQWCLLRSTLLPARERALAGDLLATLGDPRAHLLEVDRMRFVAVPRGAFWMGEEGDENAPLHCNETLAYDYWIAAAPVTVAQFAQFVAASAYRAHEPNALRYPENRPVVEVSWHDARAFCAWLAERWRDRLPVGWSVSRCPPKPSGRKPRVAACRFRWQCSSTTARDGFALATSTWQHNPEPQRVYPWGDDWARREGQCRCECWRDQHARLLRTGRSPYGCEDLCGNIWEWTRSLWGSRWDKPDFVYPYDARDPKREDLDAPDNVIRVVRGGSWRYHREPRPLRLPPRVSPWPSGWRLAVFGWCCVLPLFFDSVLCSL
jgi:formylglycine-generating enzyme required for sulfatase activity